LGFSLYAPWDSNPEPADCERVESAGIGVDSAWGGDFDDFGFMPRERTALMERLGGCIDLRAQAAAILRDPFGLPPELAESVADRYLATDAARDNVTSGDVVDSGLEARTTAAMQDAMGHCQAKPAPSARSGARPARRRPGSNECDGPGRSGRSASQGRRESKSATIA
jgi:hypothetical protein